MKSKKSNKSNEPKKMSKKTIDMTGLVMAENGVPESRITVIDYAGSGKSGAYWRCLCSCGNVKTILGSRLRSGATLSCGCLISEKARERMLKLHEMQNDGKEIFYRPFRNMTGWVMSENGVPKSKLVVEKFVGNVRTPKGQTMKLWQCRCLECGNTCVFTGGHIHHGDVLTCGCGKHKPRTKTDKVADKDKQKINTDNSDGNDKES